MATAVSQIARDVYDVGPWGFTQTNVYMVRTGSSWVLIDAGWARDAARIAHAANAVFGHVAPAAILLTHCHPDHSGAAGELARMWGCPVWMHPDELPIAVGDFAAMQAVAGPLDRRVILPFMSAMGRRRRQAVLTAGSLADVARTFTPGSDVPCLPGWECIATPGHTPGHVSYLRSDDGVLVSGDALCTLHIDSVLGLLLQRSGLSGPPWYTTWDPTTAASSMAMLLRLQPTVIAGGHGRPLRGAAIDTAQEAAREPSPSPSLA